MRRLLWLVPAVALAATPRYARMAESTGTVEVQLTAASDWIEAGRNLTLPEGAWLRTGAAARAEVQLDDNSVLDLGPETQVALADQTRLATGQRITLISVDRGIAYLSGGGAERDALSVAIPGAQVTLTPGARVRLDVAERGSAVAVLGGAVRFASPAAELQLRSGQAARVDPASPARFFLDTEIVPEQLDQWAADRAGARFGRPDLDAAGEWIVTADLGSVWRPKVAESWVPFHDGYWRWYDGLGYTWVSAEPWGWLPYHYGRWTRLDKLGWVWTGGQGAVFQPGDVYWLRNEDDGYLGWGPLNPGEKWPADDPVNRQPQEFLNAFTTFAAFVPGALEIDPADFERPKDPLAGSEFEDAPPSPPLVASRIEAMRPAVVSPRARVAPVVEGTTYETAAMSAPPPPRPTVVVVTQPAPPPAPAPAPDPEVVAVPVFYPVVVGAVSPQTAPQRSKPAPVAAAPPRKRLRNATETGLYGLIVKHLEGRNWAKALEALEGWSDRFHDSDYAAERRYFYMLAYNGLNQPAKVVETAAALFERGTPVPLDDPMQALSASYLAVTNFARLPHPVRDQQATGHAAARALLALAPECLKSGELAKARPELEAQARQVLARR
jgi:hypothetical protein